MKRTVTAKFVEISLEDMTSYLKRAFRVLRPKLKVGYKGQYVIDLFLSDNVVISVLTSIFKGHEKVRGVGKDAIKIGLCNAKTGVPFDAG
jgi:hypothetical protein